jgi:elongation factor Ts
MSATINAKMVSDLRARTGAGLMDCKRALAETSGNEEEAVTLLKKRGVATAEKKSGRDASEGIIQSYIHLGGKVGVLIEVNCESDFVAKNEGFQAFVKDLCMHIAAANPKWLSRKDVPEDALTKEKEIAAAQVEGKPAHAVEKIVEGKISKWLSTNCLLDQPFVKNPDQSIQDLLTQKIATIGENIIIRRFTRYQIGE